MSLKRTLVSWVAAVVVGWGFVGPAAADAPLRAPLPEVRLTQETAAPVPSGAQWGARFATAPRPKATRDGHEIRRRVGLTGRSGWLAVDLDTGEVIDAFAPDAPFAPASVAKLPTALFALATFGAGHRFETRLLATGPVSNGVLQGDLILAGGGDPELDTDGLFHLVDALAAAGVVRVSGRFLTDVSAAIELPEIDPVQPVDVAYNPSVSALNLNFNRVRMRWQGSGGAGGITLSAQARTLDPPVTSVQAVSVPSGVPYVHERTDVGEQWRIAASTLRRSGERWLPVKRPARYAGDVFRTLAAARGIAVPRPTDGHAPETARLIGQKPSRQLASILRDMLKYSTNLTAEVVGLLAAQQVRKVGDLAQSAAIMNAWVARTSGYDTGDRAIGFRNHSGLSVGSRVAPSRMVALLMRAAAAPAAPLPAHAGLPGIAAPLLKPYAIATKDDPTAYAGAEVRAKTGTMDRIRGLSGYVLTPRGRRIAFAVFSNEIEARGRARAGVGAGWMRRAKGFERALIRNWVDLADS